jgi:precorrin-3B methylase
MTGTLHIVGLGPGGPEHRTPAASAAITGAEVVVGYGPYVEQCADLLHRGQELIRGRMGEEAARADDAVARASAGARVTLVSSGDPGVYGMSAALAAGALLGAPLADDWASLSLSDLHLPWATVERRLLAVAAAGLALALYNPRSRTRTWQLERVLELLSEHRGAGAPVGVVTDAGRPGQSVRCVTLGTLDPETVTMRTLLLVAGETGRRAGPWLVAHRAEEHGA